MTMSYVSQPSRPPPMPTFHLLGAALHVVILLCWAGIVPAWRLLPPEGQAVVEPALGQLYWPALAFAGAVALAALLRFAGWLGEGFDRLARLGLQVGGIVFACLVFKAIIGLASTDLGLGWQGAIIMALLHVGASVGLLVLPFVAVIVVVVGLLSLLFRALRAA
jgi:hypothetical protein